MRIESNGLSLEVDVQGPPAGEPLLLVMGLGMQLVNWPQSLVGELLHRGFRVIRYDHRDIGQSQRLDELGVPNLAWAGMRHMLGLAVRAPYRIADLAADAVGVLDALQLGSAHVCGVSMGGMIGQHLAADHGSRVRSLTLVMTTSGARELPQPGWKARKAMMSRPRSAAVDDVVVHVQRLMEVVGSPGFPTDPRQLAERTRLAHARGWHPAGTARHVEAVIADGDRTPMLARIVAPTHVIHGLGDPLVPCAAARQLAAHIRGATLDLVPGMGHDLPDALAVRLAEGIASNAARARAVPA